MSDARFMHRCLELADIGRGHVGNAPLVGSVLVREGTILAESFYEEFGKSHAERSLLEKFDQEIRSTDVLYVNLEPCSHHGKTPPCTDIIIERGIKNVVYGMVDPDSRVSGKGIEKLRKAGVSVTQSAFRASCEYVNRGFLSARTKGRPWITLKKAQTKDGSIANADGSRMKITSDIQDHWSHEYLRSRHDAVLVGAGTIVTDDPSLTLRCMEPRKMNKKIDQEIPQPYRLILDPHLRVPLSANVLTDQFLHRTLVIYCSKSEKVDQGKWKTLEEQGIRLFDIDMREGNFDWEHLWRVLLTPQDGFHGLTSILVEGGPRTWGLFRSNGFVDEEVTLVGKPLT